MKCDTPGCGFPAVAHNKYGQAFCADCMKLDVERKLEAEEEAEIDAIHDAANEAGSDDWYYGKTPNPYAAGSRKAEAWDYAYRNAYARDRGY